MLYWDCQWQFATQISTLGFGESDSWELEFEQQIMMGMSFYWKCDWEVVYLIFLFETLISYCVLLISRFSFILYSFHNGFGIPKTSFKNNISTKIWFVETC